MAIAMLSKQPPGSGEIPGGTPQVPPFADVRLP